MDIKIVIGAQYGDEGKGRMVDYFTRDCNKMTHDMAVVLTNGSAQRGHTVVNGRYEHVFHHFGSGTLNGADTLITSEFLIHPMVFRKEWQELTDLGCRHLSVYASTKCRIVTPWDVLINQCWESVKGDVKFGSCGMGVYEAIERSKIEKYNITLRDVCDCCREKNWESLIKKFNSIVMDYVPNRLHQLLGDTPIPNKFIDVLQKDYIGSFIDDLEFFAAHTFNIIDCMAWGYKRIVFENAQGLAISQKYYELGENTTPTYTGVRSAINALNELDFGDSDADNPWGKQETPAFDIEVCYVTRWYTTRHGGGKLPWEMNPINLSEEIRDSTNIPNEWQGTIRYAKFDISNFAYYVNNDIFDFCTFNTGNCKVSFAVTHLDEVTDGIICKMNGKDVVLRRNGFCGNLIDIVDGYGHLTSKRKGYGLYMGYGADSSVTMAFNIKEEN